MPFLSLKLTGMDKARAIRTGWNPNEWAIRVDAGISPVVVHWLRTFIASFSRAQGRSIDTAFSGSHLVAYGNLVEYFIQTGTRAHLIMGNPLLAFNWRGQHWVLPYVHHPGTRSTEYVNWAAEAIRAPLAEVGRAEALAMFGLAP